MNNKKQVHNLTMVSSAGTDIGGNIIAHAPIKFNIFNSLYAIGNIFNSSGNLLIEGTALGCRLSCKQISYRSLFNYLLSEKIRIEKMRITSIDNAQLLTDFRIIQNPVFGDETITDFNVSNSVAPDNVQPIVDVPLYGFLIDKTTALEYTYTSIQKVTLDFFVSEV